MNYHSDIEISKIEKNKRIFEKLLTIPAQGDMIQSEKRRNENENYN